jgi:hypothetical protein
MQLLSVYSSWKKQLNHRGTENTEKKQIVVSILALTKEVNTVDMTTD